MERPDHQVILVRPAAEMRAEKSSVTRTISELACREGGAGTEGISASFR